MYVSYDIDGTFDDLEEEEIRPLLITINMPERAEIVAGIKPMFKYIQDHLDRRQQTNTNQILDVRYRGRGQQIHCICLVSSSVSDTIDTKQAVSGAPSSRYSGYRLYLAQFQIQWIRI